MAAIQINKDMLIGEIIEADAGNMGVAKFLLEIGMHCLGCPAARGESLAQACEVHDVNCDQLVEKINAYFKAKSEEKK